MIPVFKLTMLFLIPMYAHAQTTRKCCDRGTERRFESDSTVYVSIIADKSPYPKNGFSAYYNWISNNLNKDFKSEKGTKKKRVFVNFIVHENGTINGFSVIKGIANRENEEALRLVRENPEPWVAGECCGKKVKCMNMVVVYF
jgi:hypothetical protein